MMKLSFSDLPAPRRRGITLILASFFFLGQLLGVWFSGSASELLFSTMRMLPGSHASIIGLLSAAVLPFLFSACAVYLRQPLILIPIAFWKAFLFSYIGFGLFRAWGSAGWLLLGLTMFSSLSSMPVLCWYWLRHIGGRPFEPGVCCLILGGLVVIGIIDYCLIVPFLANIITF